MKINEVPFDDEHGPIADGAWKLLSPAEAERLGQKHCSAAQR
jgi:hypothetical protein